MTNATETARARNRSRLFLVAAFVVLGVLGTLTRRSPGSA